MADVGSSEAETMPGRYALVGSVLLVIAGQFFINVDEAPQVFMAAAIVLGAGGPYLLIAGAVARGIEVSRR